MKTRVIGGLAWRVMHPPCELVQRTIAAGGMKSPLAYPVEVLERFMGEHCS